MSDVLEQSIESVKKSKSSFCRFISANDCGTTGSHQAGFYIPKNAIELVFDTPGVKGKNKDKFVTIKWQNDFETDSRFIYYGVGTRDEYRLTRFRKKFPYLTDNNVGDLLIISQIEPQYYEAFVLSHDNDIEDFFSACNITANETNKLIPKKIEIDSGSKLIQCFKSFVSTITTSFPSTIDLATNARDCFNSSFKITDKFVKTNPDKNLLNWLDAEYQLFKLIENEIYLEDLKKPFKTVEELILFANSLLNRRKSRAGKSLEYHLEEVFRISGLKFDTQAITEDNKKPDFIFPDIASYRNPKFENDKLIFLASKTTCKDRWRQIINEADNIKTKHLFTLQQGISKNQLIEMYNHHVCLVVPKDYLDSFPKEFKSKIHTLESFIKFTASKQV